MSTHSIVNWATRAAIIAACAFAGTLPAAADTAPAPNPTAEGGSHQLSASEGCMNQWLFDGLWRLRVTNVAPVMDSMGLLPGYAVTISVRNGSNATTQLEQTGVQLKPAGHLVFDDGNTLDSTDAADIVSWNNELFKDLPPSAGFTHTINYFFNPKPATIPKPVKWLWDIDKSKAWKNAPHYTIADPSFRVDLTCSK
jgi:hypothetical protein